MIGYLCSRFVVKDAQKYKPIIPHLKWMIKCYILEIVKMDVDITSIMKKSPILKPKEQPKDIQNLNVGVIWNKHWRIIYKRKEDEDIHKCMCFLMDKHLYSMNVLKLIISLAEANKENYDADIKCISDMIRWYLSI
ncbi:unnamed protein product [Lactuca saligna]|uniref:Uncharacterized protein n=1 Tax=Lactuca saligna TaxID=75948 RepID=A0AA35YL70_LACSI|nr:unnamed protein product [Lactuca saligna]